MKHVGGIVVGDPARSMERTRSIVRGFVLCGVLGALVLACGGGGNGGDDPGDECLVLTGSCGAIPALRERALDAPTMQVHIEARFLAVQDEFIADVGIDFTTLQDSVPGARTVPGGTNGHDTCIGTCTQVVGGIPGMEVFVPGAHAPDELLPAFWPYAATPWSEFAAFIGLPGPGCVQFVDGAWTGVPDAPASLPDSTLLPDPLILDGRLATALLDDSALASLLAAALARDDTILQAPRVHAYPGQLAHIQINNVKALVSHLTHGFGPPAEALGPPDGEVWAGPALTLIPHLVDDSDVITLEVLPTRGILCPRPQDVTVAGVPGWLEVPLIQHREIRTSIPVPDGQTLILGGLLRDGETEVRQGVPFLNDLPLTGLLFHTDRVPDDRDLIVLITPHLVDSSE